MDSYPSSVCAVQRAGVPRPGEPLFRHLQSSHGGAWQPGDRQYALSVWAIAQWIHKNVESGNIRYPLGFSAYSSDQKGEGTPVKV